MAHNHPSNPLTHDTEDISAFSWDPSTSPTFPSPRHDLNALSTYHITIKAFTPDPSIGATNILASPFSSPQEILKAYSTPSTFPNPLLLPTTLVHPSTLDFDRIGILFAFQSMYFVVFQDASDVVNRGFLDKNLVGAHLVAEWASLPKERVGRCVVAKGEGGWWGVRSKVVGEVRESVAWRMREMVRMERNREFEEEEGSYRRRLREELGGVVDCVYKRIGRDEVGMKKEEEGMAEWLDWGARGEQDGGEEDAVPMEDVLQGHEAMQEKDAMQEEDVMQESKEDATQEGIAMPEGHTGDEVTMQEDDAIPKEDTMQE